MQERRVFPYSGRLEQRRIEAILRERGVFAFGNFEGNGSGVPYEAEQFVDHYLSGGARVQCLLDRNIVSPLLRAARGEVLNTNDPTVVVASALMAFSAAAGIDLEPSLALYEVAQKTSAEVASADLRLFRIAHAVEPFAFENVALGRMDRIPSTLLSEAQGRAQRDTIPAGAFNVQLNEWKRHRLPLTKLAVLMREGPSLSAMMELLRWSKEEAYLDALVLTLGLVELSPRRHIGALRGVRSPDPTKCLAVVDNVAWDLTYASKVTQLGSSGHWLMCTADEPLRELIQIAIGKAGDGADLCDRYWDAADADELKAEYRAAEAILPRVFEDEGEERIARLEGIRHRLVEEIVARS